MGRDAVLENRLLPGDLPQGGFSSALIQLFEPKELFYLRVNLLQASSVRRPPEQNSMARCKTMRKREGQGLQLVLDASERAGAH
jgi:hypothetical protein